MTFNLEEIEKRLGFSFTQPDLLKTAFTHPSYKNEMRGEISDNERLEFLGDSILNLIVTEHLFLLLPNMNEGSLSTIRSEMVNAQSCYRYTEMLGVGDFLLIGKGEKKHPERGKPSAYANLFEAILGAIYLDSGLSPARRITVPLLPPLHEILTLAKGNPKNSLQQIVQKQFSSLPVYQIQSITRNGLSEYEAAVYVQETLMGIGYGSSKKEAEKQAAKNALECLENES
ncbi:ribonuclease III [Chlamydiifrater volucris]|uniref:ribonuclease III n=1 Tax=Chlamydiifrater volucris TaxID=2681470 RepID=UPI001BCAD607|nr:ribonuclease III [Chlamydiifrater volucris]